MKYLITNLENYGIIYYTDNKPVLANLISSSFLDCYVRPINDNHPMIDIFTKNDNSKFKQNNYKIDITTNKISILEESALTKSFLSTKSIADNRAHAFDFLLSCVNHVWNKTLTFPHAEIYSIIRDDLYEQSELVKIYSEANDIDDESAYKELKLFNDSDNLVRMRIFSHYNYFVKQISGIINKEDIKPITDQILHRFFKNASI